MGAVGVVFPRYRSEQSIDEQSIDEQSIDEQSIDERIARLKKTREEVGLPWQAARVDDCSPDGTWVVPICQRA